MILLLVSVNCRPERGSRRDARSKKKEGAIPEELSPSSNDNPCSQANLGKKLTSRRLGPPFCSSQLAKGRHLHCISVTHAVSNRPAVPPPSVR